MVMSLTGNDQINTFEQMLKCQRMRNTTSIRADDSLIKGIGPAKAFEDIQIGDIYFLRFGYDMTINEFYKVVGKRGKSTCDFVHIGSKSIDGNLYSPYGGQVVPDPDKLENGPFTNEFSSRYRDGYFHCPWPDKTLFPWDGQPLYENHWD